MARQTTVIVTCDRCKKQYDPDEGSTSPRPAQVALAVNRKEDCGSNDPGQFVVLFFEDLCPKCDDRIDKLIRQMALEKDEGNGSERLED